MRLSAVIALALIVPACSSPEGPAAQPGETGTPAPDPSPAPVATAPATAEAATIPPALRGRWGLVPADCTSTRGDAKGLLAIDADRLTFYESVGSLATIGDSGPDRLRATFAFTGEGMNWQRDMLLTVADGGTTLIRQEFGSDALPQPLRYRRC